MADILDGYFPAPLKKNYPDGVPLTIVDKIEEIYRGDNFDNLGPRNITNMDEYALKPMSKEQFLSQIPNSVIKNGKVLPIKEVIEKKLGGGENSTVLKNQSSETNINLLAGG